MYIVEVPVPIEIDVTTLAEVAVSVRIDTPDPSAIGLIVGDSRTCIAALLDAVAIVVAPFHRPSIAERRLIVIGIEGATQSALIECRTGQGRTDRQ